MSPLHYNQGWAKGFQDAVHYWGFWNEEDTPYFWTDTPETFYKLAGLLTEDIWE
jgi:hypothetical protein